MEKKIPLSKIEYEVLKVLFSIPYALNIMNVRNKIILRELKEHPDIRKSVNESIEKRPIHQTEYINIVDKFLTTYGVMVPSFRTIEKALVSLEKMGKVTHRISEGKKEKGLWAFG